MHIQGLSVLLLVICCLSIDAQHPDCHGLKERCESCVRSLNDPLNNGEFMNRECREKAGRRWVWRDLNRCQLQVIVCGVHDRKLDCEVIAELAGMQRRLP